jgi:hypothetical protein
MHLISSVLDTSLNDVESNNSINQALAINQLQEKKGHINYISKGTLDAADYYRTKFSNDGTIKIFVSGKMQVVQPLIYFCTVLMEESCRDRSFLVIYRTPRMYRPENLLTIR